MRKASVVAGLVVGLMLSFAPSVRAQSDQSDAEKKALEDIEHKAAEAKKKAIEKFEKQKAQADKKQAAKETAARKKEEAKRKKEEAKRKKEEEAERKKHPSEPLPEPPPAPPPEPPPAAAEPPPPPAPLPPPSRPEARPIERVQDARWTAIGFVQPSDVAQSSAANDSGVAVPATGGKLGMNRVSMFFGASRARFNPVNDGQTDDQTAFGMVDFDLGLRAQFRSLGGFVAPWFDIGFGYALGSRKETDSVGTETGYTFKVSALRVDGRFGVDAVPIEYVTAGPWIGYRFELFSVKYANDAATSGALCSGESSASTTSISACSGSWNGLEYGLHVKLRTHSTPAEPERAYADASFGWRKGKYQTTSNAGVELGVRAGTVFFVGWYEQRLGSSGSFTPGDVADLGEAAAASMPVDQRIGGGVDVLF